MVFKLFALPAAVIALSTMGASAAVVDLSSLDGTVATTQSVPELTISTTVAGAGIGVASQVVNGATESIFCALTTVCANDFAISFTTASTGVKITALDVMPATATSAMDMTEISVFGLLNTLLGTVTLTSADVFATTPDSNGLFSLELDFSGFGAISSLFFDDQAADPQATGGFLYYGIEAAPVPLPSSLPLLALGLGVIGMARRGKRKTA